MSLIDDYNRDGYVVVRNVIDADLIKEASNHVEWLMKKNPGRRPEQLWQDLIPNDPFWVRLVGDRRLGAEFGADPLAHERGGGVPQIDVGIEARRDALDHHHRLLEQQ